MFADWFATKFCYLHVSYLSNKLDKFLVICLGNSVIADAHELGPDLCLSQSFAFLLESQILPCDLGSSGLGSRHLCGNVLEVDSAAYGEKKC